MHLPLRANAALLAALLLLLPEVAAADRGNFMEDFVNWDWDLSDLWDAAMRTVAYYYQEHGVIAIGVTIGVVILIGLSLDLTHSMTSLILAQMWRATFGAVFVGVGLLFAFSARWISGFAVARFRDLANALTHKEHSTSSGRLTRAFSRMGRWLRQILFPTPKH